MTYRSFRISTEDKKSVVVTETFDKTIDGVTYTFDIETTWRWGSAVVSGEDLEESDFHQEGGFELTGWEIDDQNYDDGVALWFNYSDNFTDEMKEEVERLWEEDGYSGLEENEWYMCDVETWFYGPINVELLEERETEEEEESSSDKPKWPFS